MTCTFQSKHSLNKAIKLKETIMSELKLSNRYDCLHDMQIAEYPEIEQDRNIFDNMFSIGTRNIFNIRRTRIFVKLRNPKVSKGLEVHPSSNIDVKSFKMKKSDRLSCFKTLNRFNILCDNPEENIKVLIKRSSIVTANKRSLKKCRTCNFKKRRCVLNPICCSATYKVCDYCKKVGHFPKSLCCKKRRKTDEKKKIKRTSTKCPPIAISKKNMKLIKLRIQQLNFQNQRKCIIKLAYKCAKKFENVKFGQEPQTTNDYCTKKLKKVLKIQSFPDTENQALIKNILNAFDQMYYKEDFSSEISSIAGSNMKNQDEQDLVTDDQLFQVSEDNMSESSQDRNVIPQLDGNISLFSEDETPIIQLDGNDSLLTEDEERIKKSMFSINCASEEVTQLVTFFKSFNFVWETIDWHNLCRYKSLEESCFFCHMRSSCLRLNGERLKGPKSLKINEFVSQLDKYKTFLGWDWNLNANNLPIFIRNTFSLLQIYEKKIPVLFGLQNEDEECKICKKLPNLPSSIVYQVDTSVILKANKDVSINVLLAHLVRNSASNNCCKKTKKFKSSKTRCILMELSNPLLLSIPDSEEYEGNKIIINSLVTEERSEGLVSYSSIFRHKNGAYYQNLNGSLVESRSTKKMVKVISILISGAEERCSKINCEMYKFDVKVLKQLDRKCESILCKEQYKKRKMAEREYDMKRDQSASRRKMHKDIDQKRDQTDERKNMHKHIDQKRNQTDERKDLNKHIDQKRDKTNKRKDMHKHIDKVRDQDEARKIMHQNVDKLRDKAPKRKSFHKRVDKIRDKTPKRRTMHKVIDNKRNQEEKRKTQLSDYEQTETRRHYVNTRNRLRYQKKLIQTLATDTGFDVICSSCLQYKSLHYCKPVSVLSKEKRNRFIVKMCNILQNRSDQQYVCNLCLNDIKNDKFPKRSHKDRFKFANFPTNFIKKLKRRCRFTEPDLSQGHLIDRVQYEREYFKLNRLESYLLKLVIPFIRIANCPRGRYLKVRGDLILISSDLSHSLTEILPLQQSLVPVCFKRKLSYDGSYIEEYIEKEKIHMYFTWFKANNHLYKDLNFNMDNVSQFESDSITLPDDVEERLNTNTPTGFLSRQVQEEMVVDENSNPLLSNPFEVYPTLEDDKMKVDQDQTTLFMNKYCEDPNVPSVANRMADIIVEYESEKKIMIENDCDFELDDEEVTEEEFLAQIDIELDEQLTDEEEKSEKAFDGNMEQNEEENSDVDKISGPSDEQISFVREKAKRQAAIIEERVKKISVAPGEFGAFQNWGKDIFLEERAFPEKFPYGTGGYLSSCIHDEGNDMGFASYCINQIMSADPKFRNDSSYLFFLLLVKELIQLKRCKSTYFRQATRLPNMTKESILNIDKSNLSRFNRSYQVFKNMRGTSMYYEESKKNLMAHLRQNGCPTVFLTLSCAEFDWPELLKEILETVHRKKVTDEYIADLSQSAKNKIISENVVQSTLHFQKRVDKLFSIMQDDFFDAGDDSYHVSSYFYRIEFQQRGAPHLHSLLWLKNKNGHDAPNFWSEAGVQSTSRDECETEMLQKDKEKLEKVHNFIDLLISTSSDDISCQNHNSNFQDIDCVECKILKEKVKKYQTHQHTFTCSKKGRTLTIKETEGHGRFDGQLKGVELSNIQVCRFRFPKFPLDETKVVRGISKDEDEEALKVKKADLNKIVKFLIRQTYTEKKIDDLCSWKRLKQLDFWQFLFEVGMFKGDKSFNEYSEKDRKKAKARYLDAISASVQGSAIVVLKRNVEDIFVNGYNSKLMRLHRANHDIQLCIDQYSCAQYICGYLTKNESGMSKLLKAVDEEYNDGKEIDKINALAAVLDKHREVSVQEAVYRLLSLPMTKSSVKVKYISTVHPNFRDGLLKGKIDELSDDESVFHCSVHEYYQNRPDKSDDPDVEYEPEELVEDYWCNLSLTEFWSKYEVVYNKNARKKIKLGKKTKVQYLINGMGFIRKRSEMAILRYYLNYSNDEDLARGLLILFMPFRNEMEEIHHQDVKQLLDDSNLVITEKRKIFEKYKVMSDLIAEIHKEVLDEDNIKDSEDQDDLEEIETTDPQNIEDFNKWARCQASKELSSMKNLTDVSDPIKLRSSISSLNEQQRKLFDDFTERMVSSNVSDPPVFLYLAGNAGTGKSFLTNVLIEAVKSMKIKAGDELKKPPVIVMAPTANAAHIIGGKTIDSVLRLNPHNVNHYTQADDRRLSMMKFQYENVKAIFCDEISMVGSKKLSKINFRFQDIADGCKKKKFMGDISFVASGNS